MPKYHTPPGSSVQPIVDAIKDNRRQMRDAQRPSGTNLSSLVAQVQTALVNINASVIAAIAANSYTQAQINAGWYTKTQIDAGWYTKGQTDSKVANPGDIAPGAVNASGVVTANAGVSSTDARNRVLASGYAGLWADSSGRFGISPSSIRFKQDIQLWAPEIAALLELRGKTFRYKASMVDGDVNDGPRQLGFIAEELEALGFPEFVFYDEEGLVQGINYDRMVVALLELVRYEDDRVDALQARVEALENGL